MPAYRSQKRQPVIGKGPAVTADSVATPSWRRNRSVVVYAYRYEDVALEYIPVKEGQGVYFAPAGDFSINLLVDVPEQRSLSSG